MRLLFPHPETASRTPPTPPKNETWRWFTRLCFFQDGLLPSDEAVLQAYDDCLREQQGHYTCLDTLLQVLTVPLKPVRRAGSAILSFGGEVCRVRFEHLLGVGITVWYNLNSAV